MSENSLDTQEERRKFSFILSVRWVIFFFSLIFIALKTLTTPLLYSYYLWFFGFFFIINLIYSFLYFNKNFRLSKIFTPSLILDFFIVSIADFLSGGLSNHLGIIFYLFLIIGSAILISYQFSFYLALAAVFFNSLLFLFQSYKLYSLNFLLITEDTSNFFAIFSSFLERVGLIAGLLLLERYFILSTERKTQTTQAEREEIAQVLEGLGDGLLLLDSEGKVLTGNYQVEKLIGAEISSLKGKILFADPTIFSHTLEFSNSNPVSWINEVKETKTARKFEFKVLLPLEERHIRVNLAPIISSNEISGMIALFEDISKSKQLEEMKSDFLSTVSHELRTPLTTIKGYVSLLLNPKSQIKEEKKVEFLQAIERQTDNLAQMINELLDVSRLEAGRLELKKQPTLLKNLIEKVVANLHPRFRNRTVQIKLSPQLPPLLVDPDRIDQVFTNLIDNALKYTPADTPVIIEGWKEKDRVVIMVQDFGPGIAPAEIPYIFEKFHRVDRRLTREVEGTGLGLYIAKNLVEAHGGKIWVESVPDQGSKFFVALPISYDNYEI